MRTSEAIIAVLFVAAVIAYPLAILKAVLILVLIPVVVVAAFAVGAIYYRRGW